MSMSGYTLDNLRRRISNYRTEQRNCLRRVAIEMESLEGDYERSVLESKNQIEVGAASVAYFHSRGALESKLRSIRSDIGILSKVYRPMVLLRILNRKISCFLNEMVDAKNVVNSRIPINYNFLDL
jgi:hypothetical protein